MDKEFSQLMDESLKIHHERVVNVFGVSVSGCHGGCEVATTTIAGKEVGVVIGVCMDSPGTSPRVKGLADQLVNAIRATNKANPTTHPQGEPNGNF